MRTTGSNKSSSLIQYPQQYEPKSTYFKVFHHAICFSLLLLPPPSISRSCIQVSTLFPNIFNPCSFRVSDPSFMHKTSGKFTSSCVLIVRNSDTAWENKDSEPNDRLQSTHFQNSIYSHPTTDVHFVANEIHSFTAIKLANVSRVKYWFCICQPTHVTHIWTSRNVVHAQSTFT